MALRLWGPWVTREFEARVAYRLEYVFERSAFLALDIFLEHLIQVGALGHLNHTTVRGNPLVQGRVEINILLASELRESFVKRGPVRLENLLLAAGAEPDEKRIAYEVRR